MKKELLCLALSLFTLAGTAQEQSFEWASLIQASHTTTTPYDVVANSDKDVFIMSQYGTTSADITLQSTTFLGESFTGAPYNGNSSNANLLITKSDANGNFEWAIHTEHGDIATSQSAITPTADGGFFLIAKVRHASTNFMGDNIVLGLVDSEGTATDIVYRLEDSAWADGNYHWAYTGAMVKVSGEGKVEWTKHIEMDVTPMESATTYSYGTTNAVNFYGAAVDSKGNFYIAGNLRKTMTFDGGHEVECHNTSTWNGDSQQTVGSSFIVKVDSEGNYVSHLTTEAPEGDFTYDDVKTMEIKDDVLYVVGNVKGGDDAKTMTWGNGTSIVPNKHQSSYMAAINTNLEAQWLNFYPLGEGTDGKDGFTQQHGITVDGDKVYLTMGLDGSIMNPENPEEMLIQHKKGFLAGAMIVCDKADGALTDAVLVSESTMIAGAFDAVPSEDNLFVYYYDWGSTPKVVVKMYNKETLDLITTYPVMISTGMATVWAAAGVDDKILFAFRDNQAMSFEGTDFTFAKPAGGYTGGVVTYSFAGENFNAKEDTTTGIEQTEADKLAAYGVQGGVAVKANEAQMITIYTITGSCVYNANVEAGDTFVSLPRGIYIVNKQKVVVY